MARSKLTFDELRIQAMLLEMFYDDTDHTFFRANDTHAFIYDADTMEPLNNTPHDLNPRIKEVRAGNLGPADTKCGG